MSEHTPGPWESVPPPHLVENTSIFSGNLLVATVIERGGSDGANARLIAAAPEMLGLLRGMVAMFGETTLEYTADNPAHMDIADSMTAFADWAINERFRKAAALITRIEGDES